LCHCCCCCCCCHQVADVLTHIDPTSGAVSKALRVSTSIPTDYFCLVRGVVLFWGGGQECAVLGVQSCACMLPFLPSPACLPCRLPPALLSNNPPSPHIRNLDVRVLCPTVVTWQCWCM
jgi:hypothetical protein